MIFLFLKFVKKNFLIIDITVALFHVIHVKY